jgi:hypothetical protein
MAAAHKRYSLILLACFGATLLPVFVLNMILLGNTLGNNTKALQASEWQQRTRGITYAPTLSDTHLFKTLRLNDRLAEIDTVVFGSSTALGITQHAFPDNMRIYNYAQTGHGLNAAVAEAEYLQQHAPQVKWLVIPLDWSVGFIYRNDPVPAVDLSAAAAMQQAQSPAQQVPLLARMRDALSWPRIATLSGILKSVLKAEDKTAAFKGYFLQDGGDDYRCADGVPAKDFDIIDRGTCTGFRFDGSATFASSARVSNAQSLILSATTSSSKYHQSLASTRGTPDAALLQRIAALSQRARENGGNAILFMPPLLPGMEAELLRHPQLAAHLQNTRHMLDEWARAQHLFILDAGQSERFSCTADEFIDEHHAVANCYEKIFRSFWKRSLRPDGSINPPAEGLL